MCVCVCVWGASGETKSSSWSIMGLLIACERRSEEDAANRLNTETLNRLEGVSWGEFTQAQTEISFLVSMTEVNLEWKQ